MPVLSVRSVREHSSVGRDNALKYAGAKAQIHSPLIHLKGEI